MSARIHIASLLAAGLALGLSGCGSSGAPPASINNRARLDGPLPLNPLEWKAIESSIDRRESTMSTLYGNDAAAQCARRGGRDYPAGATLALVTWTEQDDPLWFGGKIPGPAKSVEFVRVTPGEGGRPSYAYEKYQGTPLAPAPPLDGQASEARAAYLLSLRAAVLP